MENLCCANHHVSVRGHHRLQSDPQGDSDRGAVWPSCMPDPGYHLHREPAIQDPKPLIVAEVGRHARRRPDLPELHVRQADKVRQPPASWFWPPHRHQVSRRPARSTLRRHVAVRGLGRVSAALSTPGKFKASVPSTPRPAGSGRPGPGPPPPDLPAATARSARLEDTARPARRCEPPADAAPSIPPALAPARACRSQGRRATWPSSWQQRASTGPTGAAATATARPRRAAA